MKWLDRLREAIGPAKSRTPHPPPAGTVEKKTAGRAAGDALTKLTPRERDVCMLLLEGKTLKHIAGELGIKFSTVNSHYKNVYRKLKVHNRAEFILRYGLSRPEETTKHEREEFF